MKYLNVLTLAAVSALLLAISLVTPPIHVAHAYSAATSIICQAVNVSPGAIATAGQAAGTFTCPGVVLGDTIDCSYSVDPGAVSMYCGPSAANTVRWIISNNSGGSLTPTAASKINAVIRPFYKSP